MPSYPDKAVSDYRRKKKDMPLALGDTSAYSTGGRVGSLAAPPVAEYRAPQSAAPVASPKPTQMDLGAQSRRAAVEREMLQRQVIREKQTPFVQRDATGAIDPRVSQSWALGDQKYAADRAISLSTPTKLGTAAGAKAMDEQTLAELTRQRDAEAQSGVPSVTNQPSFDKANQYRDEGLRADYFLRATRENANNRDQTYAAKDARLSDLDSRIADYKVRVAGTYQEPVRSEAARSDQLVRRDAYAAEANKAGERVTAQRGYSEELAKEMRDAQIRQVRQVGQPPVGDRLARAQEGQAVKQLDFDTKVNNFNQSLLSRGTTPEGVANLGAQALDSVASAVSSWRDGVVTGGTMTGGAKDALRQARVFRDQVVGSLESAYQSSPDLARATATALKNKLDDMLGTAETFTSDTSLVTDAIDMLLSGGRPYGTFNTGPERDELAATLNDTYKRVSAIASGQ